MGVCGDSQRLEYRSELRHTVCESRSNTFIAGGTETILVMYVSTALTTSMSTCAGVSNRLARGGRWPKLRQRSTLVVPPPMRT